MTLVVEDGTGLPGANTWAARLDLINYAALRGVTIPDSSASDVHLILAMDLLNTYAFAGQPVNEAQGTPFPRTAINPCTGDELWPDDEVPPQLVRAQLMLAQASFEGVQLTAAVRAGGSLKRRKLGPAEREYFDASAANMFALVPGVDGLLLPYLQRSPMRLMTVRA